MKKLLLGFAFFLLISNQILPLNRQLFAQENNSDKIRVIYFSAKDCSKCRQIEPFIEEIKKKYQDEIDFLEHDVKEKEECRQLFYHFVSTYNVPAENAKTPIIFAGKKYLAGTEDIKNKLEEEIAKSVKNKEDLLFDCHKFLEQWPNVDRIDFTGSLGGEDGCGIDTSNICSVENGNKSSKNHKKISLALVATTAIIDSVNPCAIAVLIFLLTILASMKASRKRIIKVGLVYIAAVFATYYLSGLGLLKIITQFNIAAQIGVIAGLIVLLAGFLEIKEGLYPDGKQLLVIPQKTKPLLASFLKKGTIPSVFIAGILVSAFELPCTGQVYLAILSMFSKEELAAQGYFYLLIYNLIFVLPLVIILIIAAWGFDLERMKHMQKKTKMIVKIMMGVIMVLLGIFLLFQDKIIEIIRM